MDPHGLTTKIFLDGGDPGETREIIKLLGFLDGQTTNPTLISKNPEARERLKKGDKYTEEEIYRFYKNVVGEISTLIPQGSISIEVYADLSTGAEQMYKQGSGCFHGSPMRILNSLPHKDFDLSRNWQGFDVNHDLTVTGMEKFSADWNSLVK